MLLLISLILSEPTSNPSANPVGSTQKYTLNLTGSHHPHKDNTVSSHHVLFSGLLQYLLFRLPTSTLDPFNPFSTQQPEYPFKNANQITSFLSQNSPTSPVTQNKAWILKITSGPRVAWPLLPSLPLISSVLF